jgi:hypothetical protein
MDINKVKNKECRVFKIYCLKDPFTLKIKYIGVTVSNLNQRLSQHVYDSKNSGTHKRNWIKNLISQNKKPIICLLEYCNYKNWEQKEKLWIKRFSDLTNTSRGGAGLVINRKIDSIDKSARGHWKSIIAIDINKNILNFKCLRDATKTLKIPQTNISEVLSKRSNCCYGYHFTYEREYYENYEKEIIITVKKKKIYFIYNNVKYSLVELSNLLKCSQSILNHIAHGKRCWNNSKFFKITDTLEIIMI